MAYRKTEETYFSSTSYGRNRGLVHREGCDVSHNGTPRATIHPPSPASLQPPRATVHPPSTSSSLHLRLFIHGLLIIQPPPHATPPATVQPALSTGSCSTSPPRATIHPTLHRLLFNHPSMVSCSSTTTGSIGVLFIPWQWPLLARGPVHPTPTGNCSSNPRQCSLFIKRQKVQSASVSSSCKGIARLGSVNS